MHGAWLGAAVRTYRYVPYAVRVTTQIVYCSRCPDPGLQAVARGRGGGYAWNLDIIIRIVLRPDLTGGLSHEIHIRRRELKYLQPHINGEQPIGSQAGWMQACTARQEVGTPENK